MVMMQRTAVHISRFIGRCVCKLRGHNYYYPGGECCSLFSYACIRCNELDFPIDDNQDTAATSCGDDYFRVDYDCIDYDSEREKEDFEYSRRWVKWLPYPKWL